MAAAGGSWVKGTFRPATRNFKVGQVVQATDPYSITDRLEIVGASRNVYYVRDLDARPGSFAAGISMIPRDTPLRLVG